MIKDFAFSIDIKDIYILLLLQIMSNSKIFTDFLKFAKPYETMSYIKYPAEYVGITCNALVTCTEFKGEDNLFLSCDNKHILCTFDPVNKMLYKLSNRQIIQLTVTKDYKPYHTEVLNREYDDKLTNKEVIDIIKSYGNKSDNHLVDDEHSSSENDEHPSKMCFFLNNDGTVNKKLLFLSLKKIDNEIINNFMDCVDVNKYSTFEIDILCRFIIYVRNGEDIHEFDFLSEIYEILDKNFN